jgi:murein DD-endopeptidase MepM/ murein hydrolase activator NlpD
LFGRIKKSEAYIEEFNKVDRKKVRSCIAVPEVKVPVTKIKPTTSEIERNKYKLFFSLKIVRVLLIIGLLIFLTVTGINNYLEKKSYIQAYEVYIDEECIATVKSIDEFEACMFRVQNEFADKLDEEVKISNKPEYVEVVVKESEITPVKEIENILKERVEIFVGAFTIVADGEVMAVLKDKEDATWVLDELMNPFISEDPNIRLTFGKNIEITKEHVKIGRIETKEDALKKLSVLKKDVKWYTVKENDTLWDISLDNNLPIEDILRMNSGLSENIHPGDKIALSVAEPVLPVEVREKIKFNEDIPYEIDEVEDESLFQGRRRIIEKGVNGEKLVTAEIVKVNGVEVRKDILDEVILYEPRNQTEKIGTKELPPKFGTGIFGRPLYGMITSRFGMRWGREHQGIDIAGDVGDNIYSADGGKITFAGYYGDYGYFIIINHDNEYETCYGHCSEILVEEGQRVAKGELIGKVGNTGRSTGPHLHFEVRKDGVPVNPLNYVTY